MNVKINTGDELDQRVADLCGDDVSYLLLVMSDDSVVCGCEGLAGLRLIANALYEAHAEEDEADLALTDESPRALQLHWSVNQIAETSNVPFVVCYHLEGSEHWRLVWSRDKNYAEVFRELVEYIQGGIHLDPDD